MSTGNLRLGLASAPHMPQRKAHAAEMLVRMPQQLLRDLPRQAPKHAGCAFNETQAFRKSKVSSKAKSQDSFTCTYCQNHRAVLRESLQVVECPQLGKSESNMFLQNYISRPLQALPIASAHHIIIDIDYRTG